MAGMLPHRVRSSLILVGSIAALIAWPPPTFAADARVIPAQAYQHTGDARTFTVTYVAHVTAPPPGTKRLRVWIPVPHTTPLQTISGLRFSQPPRLTTGAKYGNTFAYWEFEHPAGALDLSMSFVCRRRELRTDLPALAAAGEGVDPAIGFAVFHRPSRFAIVDVGVTRLADRITAHASTTLAKAHAIYAYVVDHMKYDKSVPGWGTGSTQYACDTGRGNCTDFHSLFNSLCRAEGIATAFEIGLYLPYDRGTDEAVGGYHCWAYFRVPGRAWVPVDCSEANREPARRSYFFGDHTNNRVALSVGRDLTLTPAQDGPPLNYFVEPYAEADGKPVAAAKTWTFADLEK